MLSPCFSGEASTVNSQEVGPDPAHPEQHGSLRRRAVAEHPSAGRALGLEEIAQRGGSPPRGRCERTEPEPAVQPRRALRLEQPPDRPVDAVPGRLVREDDPQAPAEHRLRDRPDDPQPVLPGQPLHGREGQVRPVPVPHRVELRLLDERQEVVVLHDEQSVVGESRRALGEPPAHVLLVGERVDVDDEPCPSSGGGLGHPYSASASSHDPPWWLQNSRTSAADEVRVVGEDRRDDAAGVSTARLGLDGADLVLRLGLDRAELDERAVGAAPQLERPAGIRARRVRGGEAVAEGLRRRGRRPGSTRPRRSRGSSGRPASWPERGRRRHHVRCPPMSRRRMSLGATRRSALARRGLPPGHQVKVVFVTEEGLGVPRPALHPPDPGEPEEHLLVPPVPRRLGRVGLLAGAAPSPGRRPPAAARKTFGRPRSPSHFGISYPRTSVVPPERGHHLGHEPVVLVRVVRPGGEDDVRRRRRPPPTPGAPSPRPRPTGGGRPAGRTA